MVVGIIFVTIPMSSMHHFKFEFVIFRMLRENIPPLSLDFILLHVIHLRWSILIDICMCVIWLVEYVNMHDNACLVEKLILCTTVRKINDNNLGSILSTIPKYLNSPSYYLNSITLVTGLNKGLLIPMENFVKTIQYSCLLFSFSIFFAFFFTVYYQNNTKTIKIIKLQKKYCKNSKLQTDIPIILEYLTCFYDLP